jgi:TonB family protein
MTRQQHQWFLALGLFCTLLAPAAARATGDLNLVALAMHRETGRDIYLGALYAENALASPAELAGDEGARKMEFRIAARRTSIRSVLGGILLQAEVSRGAPPGPAIVEFADAIMSAVAGSLYTGDSFSLLVTAGGVTEASVNGQLMARTRAAGVFDYFLAGWIGDRGASTAFRDSLMADEIDISLRADYSALTPEAGRVATVAAWTAPPKPKPEAPKPEVVAPSTPAEPPSAVAAADAPAEASPAPAEPDAAAPELPVAASESPAAVAAAAPAPAPAPADAEPTPAAAETVAIAAADAPAPVGSDSIPSLAMASEAPVQLEDSERRSSLLDASGLADAEGIAGMSVIEYSQRLAVFNTMVFRLVNSKIRYPRAAVRRNIEGSLELDVTLGPDGELLDVTVARSSGHDMLDESALKAAQRAFDTPPADPFDQVAVAEYADQGGRLVIPVPVNFVLTE